MADSNGNGKNIFARVSAGLILLFCASILGFCVNLNCRITAGEIERARMQTGQAYIQKALDEISRKLDSLIEKGRYNVGTRKEEDGEGGRSRGDDKA